MSRLYIETPVSVKPEKSDFYFTNLANLTWFNSLKGFWTSREGNEIGDVEWWLRPVSAQEVPSDEDIKQFAENQFPDFHNTQNEVDFINGAQYMRDTLLPTIVLLKEENEEMERCLDEAVLAGQQYRSEITSLKERVRELETIIDRYKNPF